MTLNANVAPDGSLSFNLPSPTEAGTHIISAANGTYFQIPYATDQGSGYANGQAPAVTITRGGSAVAGVSGGGTAGADGKVDLTFTGNAASSIPVDVSVAAGSLGVSNLSGIGSGYSISETAPAVVISGADKGTLAGTVSIAVDGTVSVAFSGTPTGSGNLTVSVAGGITNGPTNLTSVGSGFDPGGTGPVVTITGADKGTLAGTAVINADGTVNVSFTGSVTGTGNLTVTITQIVFNNPPTDLLVTPNLGFSSEKNQFIQSLKQNWLKASEDLIAQKYGWSTNPSDDWNVTVNESDTGPYAATTNTSWGFSGVTDVIAMQFDLPDFTPPHLSPASLADLQVAHQMVHVMQAQNSYYGDLVGDGSSSANWFKEGLASFIAGEDARVYATLGPNPPDPEIDALLSAIGTGNESVTTSNQMAANYLAVRYLHNHIVSGLSANGIKHMTEWMKTQFDAGSGPAASGITAYFATPGIGFSDNDAFISDFKGINGRNFVKTSIIPNLTNTDTGAIGGSDASGGASLDSQSVIPDATGGPSSPVNFEVDQLANVLAFSENQPVGTVVGEFNATDSDGDVLTYSITGGADQAKFDLNATTGALTFLTSPDFENPDDADGNNTYEIQVSASDGEANVTQVFTVQLTNVVEPLWNVTRSENLLGWWAFDDGTSNDLSGHGFDGNHSSPSIYVTDSPFGSGKAIDLAGDQYVSVSDGGDQSTFDGNDSFTIAFWVKGWPNGGWEPMISKHGDSGQGWQIRRLSTSPNILSFTLRGTSGSDDWGVTQNINDNQWHHLALSFGTGKRKFYLNGILIDSTNDSGAISASGSQLVLGARDNSGNSANPPAISKHSGIMLDDVRFYNVDLNDSDIGKIYNNGYGDQAPSVTSYDGNGTVALNALENQSLAAEVNASEPNGRPLAYSLGGGPDQSLFEVNASTGEVTFKTTPDFEQPGDSNADNLYQLTVLVSNGLISSSQDLNVTVTDDDSEDRDGDGFSDGQEATAGTSPDDPASKPGLNFGLLGYWPLDGNASDMSGNGRDGSPKNGAAFVSGAVGQGLYFDGHNDYLTVPTFELGGSMSIVFWGKYAQFQDWDCVMDFANSSTSKNLKINCGNSGSTTREMIFEMRTPSGNRYVGEPFWVLNEWVHLVLTVDVAGTMKLYRTGKLVDTETGSGLAEKITRSKHYFGKSTYNDNKFKGELDEIRIYDRALTAGEAMQLAQAGNSSPTDLNASSSLTIAENQPVGTIVGEFNATDPDAWSTLTYHLVNGVAQNDNHLFTLDTNGTLKTAVTFDFESNATIYSIRARVTDEQNASVEGNFTVTLTNANEAPVITSPSTANIPENQTFVLDVNASDPDDDTITYSISGGPDAAKFDLNSGTGALTFLSAPDYENPTDADANNAYVVEVNASDGTAWDLLTLTMTITDVYESTSPPTQPTDNNQTDPPPDDNGANPPVDNNQTQTDQNTTVPDPGDPTPTLFRPLPKTLPHEELANGNFRLWGQVLADGGSPVTEVAFELADNMVFRNSTFHPAAMLAGSPNFFGELTLEPGKRYYYRAVATNAMGTTSGSPKKLTTSPSQTPWWSDASPQAGAWRNSPWLGAFRPYDNGWIYHAKLGWAYAHPDGSGGLWLWFRDHHWMWTRSGVFPYLWKHDLGTWHYLLGTRNGQPVFYEWTGHAPLPQP